MKFREEFAVALVVASFISPIAFAGDPSKKEIKELFTHPLTVGISGSSTSEDEIILKSDGTYVDLFKCKLATKKCMKLTNEVTRVLASKVFDRSSRMGFLKSALRNAAYAGVSVFGGTWAGYSDVPVSLAAKGAATVTGELAPNLKGDVIRNVHLHKAFNELKKQVEENASAIRNEQSPALAIEVPTLNSAQILVDLDQLFNQVGGAKESAGVNHQNNANVVTDLTANNPELRDPAKSPNLAQ